jgi:hypothetical protein
MTEYNGEAMFRPNHFSNDYSILCTIATIDTEFSKYSNK